MDAGYLTLQIFNGFVNGSFYALLSLGLAVIFGVLRVVNFAHGSFYMLGAFAAYLLGLNLGVGDAYRRVLGRSARREKDFRRGGRGRQLGLS